MTNQESTFAPQIKWSINRLLMDAIMLAIAKDEKQTPTLPEFPQQVESLANQVYALDEIVYYYNVPESDLTLAHIREAGLDLAAKTIRLLQTLPIEKP